MPSVIPVVLFAYARPDHLHQTLDSLQKNQVPLIYAFSDGPKTLDKVPLVEQVRQMFRAIDWCEVKLHERKENLGLGRSIRTGVEEVFAKENALIVFEDDLICVPGTYQYLCAALEHYENDQRVMSVTGWTHPRLTPSGITSQPYFDGRAESWTWGTWSRSWQGMEQDAMALMRACKEKGIDSYRYGADLPEMAEIELSRNIWAVRFAFLHMLRGGLCLRPPHSMVEHIGFDELATNSVLDVGISNPPLQPSPPIPTSWPIPIENPECPKLSQHFYGAKPSLLRRTAKRIKRLIRNNLRQIGLR